jgi:DNA-binding beta-propeller fold protein YncE
MLIASLGTAFGQIPALYSPNSGSGDITGFKINANGTLTSVGTFPAPFTSANPFRAAVTPNGKFLYVSDTDGSIFANKVNPDGT